MYGNPMSTAAEDIHDVFTQASTVDVRLPGELPAGEFSYCHEQLGTAA